MSTLPTINLPFNAQFGGWVRTGAPGTLLPRAQNEQEQLVVYPLPWSGWTKHDEPWTRLTGTPAADDLGLSGATFGTNTPALTTGDLKTAGATTRYARIQYPIPPEYDPGQTAILRFRAGMVTHIADVSATLDAEVFKSNGEGGKTGSDLCTTDPLDINADTFANFDFTITPASLSPGNLFDIRIAIAVNDAATGDPVAAVIGQAALLLDIRG